MIVMQAKKSHNCENLHKCVLNVVCNSNYIIAQFVAE